MKTIINGVPTKKLSLDAARMLGDHMERYNHTCDECQKASAFFFLKTVKQELVDLECYETLHDFKRLEDWHNIDIPFKV